MITLMILKNKDTPAIHEITGHCHFLTEDDTLMVAVSYNIGEETFSTSFEVIEWIIENEDFELLNYKQ